VSSEEFELRRQVEREAREAMHELRSALGHLQPQMFAVANIEAALQHLETIRQAVFAAALHRLG